MANIGYLNPESLLPSTTELAGGQRFANPIYTAFQAQQRLDMATPFLDEALKQSKESTEQMKLSTQRSKQDASEYLDPSAIQLRKEQNVTGIQEQFIKRKELQNKEADLEAVNFYPAAKNTLKALEAGDYETAKATYETYVSRLPEDRKPPEEGRTLMSLSGEPNPQVINFLQNATQRVDSNPNLMSAIAKEAPELANRKAVAGINAQAGIDQAKIQAQAGLDIASMNLNKSEHGLFRQVLQRYNQVGWEGLEEGDKLFLRSKITESFNASPYAKIATQVAGTLGLVDGLSGKDVQKSTAAITRTLRNSFANEMGIDPRILENGSTAGGAAAPGKLGKGADLGPAPAGTKEGQEGTGKNGEKVIVINGRLIAR